MKPKFFTFVLVIVVVVLAGCASNSPSPQTNTSSLTPVKLQLSWIHTTEMAGFYEAERQGYYTEEDLAVELINGGFDESGNYIDPIQQVVEGKADFGVAGADILLLMRAEGQPIVAIAAIYQRSPVILMSLAETNIITPQDLVGKRVMIQQGTTLELTYEALLMAENIDRSQIEELLQTGEDNIAPLIEGEVDVVPNFITDGPIRAEQQGTNIELLLPSDYGIDIYTNLLFTTEEMIETKPDVVEAFVRAMVKGTEQAISDPDATTEYTIETYGEFIPLDLQTTQKEGMRASVPLLNPAGSRPGMMDEQKWEQIHQILLDQGILTEPLALEKAYTLTFLEKIYNQ